MPILLLLCKYGHKLKEIPPKVSVGLVFGLLTSLVAINTFLLSNGNEDLLSMAQRNSENLSSQLRETMASGSELFYRWGQNETNHDQRREPVMHTFFAPMETNTAGMTPEAHYEMIKVWRESWEDAGWQTRVLTIDNAKEHPMYEEVWTVLNSWEQVGEYDRLCFIRWLAMASVGGGWMADYDTLPLHDFTDEGIISNLPNGGKFTLHENYVPSLASGTSKEWLRMLELMINHTEEKKSTSDMYSLVEINEQHQKDNPKDEPLFFRQNAVLFGGDGLTGTTWTFECRFLLHPPNKRAIHFSHSSIMKATSKGTINKYGNLKEATEKRPAIAAEWLHMWLESCGGRKQFNKRAKQVQLH